MEQIWSEHYLGSQNLVCTHWCLDKGRLHPILQIKRRQLPITPAFAMTAHAAQGHTFSKGAIVDFNIGGSSSAMSSYVALTCAERRADLLIYRSFPRHLFNQGQKRGPELLRQVWRKKKEVDWKAIELQYMPRKTCPGCGMHKYEHAYGTSERAKKDDCGICFLCMERRTEEGRPFEFNSCFDWLPKASFKKHQCGVQSTHTRVCDRCLERR